MITRDFELISCDTDAVTVVKKDMSPFSKEELVQLTKELNSQFDEGISWEFEFNAPLMVVLKAKNYIVVYENGKRSVKGSSLKSSSLEPALKEMLQKLVDCLVNEEQEKMVEVYHHYVKQIRDGISDMKPWAKKMQLSPTTFNSTRTNETKIVDALKGSEYKSGDRVYMFTQPNTSLALVEHYKGFYDKDTYLEKVFRTTLRFETILPVKDMFPNYKLKKNKDKLKDIL